MRYIFIIFSIFFSLSSFSYEVVPMFIQNLADYTDNYMDIQNRKATGVFIKEDAESFNNRDVFVFKSGMILNRFESKKGIFSERISPELNFGWQKKFLDNVGFQNLFFFNNSYIGAEQQLGYELDYRRFCLFPFLSLLEKKAISNQDNSGYLSYNLGIGFNLKITRYVYLLSEISINNSNLDYIGQKMSLLYKDAFDGSVGIDFIHGWINPMKSQYIHQNHEYFKIMLFFNY